LAGVIDNVHPLDIDGETFGGSFLFRVALLVDLDSSESEVSDRRLRLVEERRIYLIGSHVLSVVCLDLYFSLNVYFNTRPLVLGDWTNLSLNNLGFLLIRFSVVDDFKNTLRVPLLKLFVKDSSLLTVGHNDLIGQELLKNIHVDGVLLKLKVIVIDRSSHNELFVLIRAV
jgi:hypothetical protein